MAAILTFFHWYELIMSFTWPLILCGDFFLRNVNPHKRRMQRGKWYLWEIRTFGIPWAFFWEIPLLMLLLGMSIALHTNIFVWGWWTYIAITCVVDWITGSDDPPFKRFVEAAKKRLTIAPPPKPVIDLS